MTPGERAQELRERAVHRLREATDAEATFSFAVAGPPDARVMTNIVSTGGADVHAIVGQYRDQTPPTGSSLSTDKESSRARRRGWTLEAPLPMSLNRFQDSARCFERPLEELEHLQVVTDYRRPLSITQEYRALIYDRGQFVAWIGALRRGRGVFGEKQRLAAARLVPALKRDLVTASTLDALRDVAYVLVDDRGHVSCGSERAVEWIDARRSSRLCSLIRHAERTGVGRRHILDGVELDIVSLHDGDSPRHTLVVLRPALGVELSGLAPLPPRQHRIASLWVTGSTVDEIARELEISTNTVKFHLKAVYAALAISSRHELAELWKSRTSRD